MNGIFSNLEGLKYILCWCNDLGGGAYHGLAQFLNSKPIIYQLITVHYNRNTQYLAVNKRQLLLALAQYTMLSGAGPC